MSSDQRRYTLHVARQMCYVNLPRHRLSIFGDIAFGDIWGCCTNIGVFALGHELVTESHSFPWEVIIRPCLLKARYEWGIAYHCFHVDTITYPYLQTQRRISKLCWLSRSQDCVVPSPETHSWNIKTRWHGLNRRMGKSQCATSSQRWHAAVEILPW